RNAEGVTGGFGGIISLLDVIEEHGAALEADLIDKGLRLRDCPTKKFNWRDLLVIYRHLGFSSHTYESMHPDQAGWTLTNQLLAASADVLRWLQWVKTEDGAAGRNI